ncbi:hypothetical protein MP478_04420 [Chryseobacterium sp. WG14]|uniref:hypothetical protein n=1 Tax=Chryseobacterium sp. WG14 TaxID=2926909 RepID=UPI00211E0A16|nr:hypothetical protein [Chryseobacterium sp. WG14]MCQ9638625.1 hypothetical protein [Chryseobacterium sp. WG14]
MTKEEQLKILSAYLPYKLKIYDPNSPVERELTHMGYWHRSSEDDVVFISIDEALEGENKPILYDMSYLTKEIEHEGEKFVPFNFLSSKIRHEIEFSTLPDIGDFNIKDYELLLKWKLNVFNLSEDEFINKATLTNKL